MESTNQQTTTPHLSFQPFLVALAVLLIVVGLLSEGAISGLGIVLLVLALVGWMNEVRRPRGAQRMVVQFETEHRTSVPQRETTKLGVWWFLAGEITLFAALIVTFAVFRIGYAGQYGSFQQRLNLPLVAANTLVLLTSSYMVVRALVAARRADSPSLVRHMVVVVVLGALFLAGQGYEWSQLFRDGLGPGDSLGGPFFTVTGVHGLHVLIGTIWASLAAVQALFGAYRGANAIGVELFGLYWHFVDIVWIVLFSVIYLV